MVASRLTAGDLRRCIEHLPGDAPVEFGFNIDACLSRVESDRLRVSGVEARPTGVDLHITLGVEEGA